ncbi:MAG: outer membrane protein assembly factor BamA [Candidatus Omnitrophica bacterium]|nr:outer membrane protein assembly factor BamA [Candidatus Omnitrophota bacterium]
MYNFIVQLKQRSIVVGITFLIIATSFAVWAQDNSTLQPQGKTITAIEVQGNTSISTTTILSKLRIRVGSVYQDTIVSDDLKRLYLLGYFSDIKISTEPYKDGVKVIIKVEERPIIDKIKVIGAKKRLAISSKTIQNTIKSKEGQPLDEALIASDVQALKELYAKKGFRDVEVESSYTIAPDTRKAVLEFNITEGRRQRIQAIYIEGNLHFSDRRILKIMKTKRAWMFNAGILKEDVLEEDIERIKTFYNNNGYIDATAKYEIETDPSGRFLYITIKIEEGKLYRVGSFMVQGNKDISESEILSKVKDSSPGSIFSYEALKSDISNIQGLYFDRGYIMAQVQETTALNRDTGRVDVIINITENNVIYVNQIKIQGNVKTKDIVIRRELRIRPGERFDGDKLRRSKERLQNLGYFEEIRYDTEDTNKEDYKDLVVEVKETKTGQLSFGGGYSSVEKFVGFIELEQKNFDWKNWPYFTGAGQNLKLRASIGSLSDSMILSFTEPWLFDYPLSFGFDIYQTQHDRETDVGYGYDEKVTGGALRLGKEIGEYWKINTVYRYDRIRIADVTETASNDLLAEVGTNNVSSFTTEVTMDTRDNIFVPLRGNVFGNALTVAGGPFGGDKDFWKYSGTLEHYMPLPHDSVIELRGRIGYARPFSSTEKIPIFDRFFCGGIYSVRGYHERSIGPIDALSKDPIGGESLVVLNAELVVPLVKYIRMGVFYDIGNVWAKASDIGQGGYKSGTGIGFRIKTPIGPLLLYYGIPLDPESGETEKDNGMFHFSMGYSLF